MCTVTILFKLFEEYPLVVAGNRDEFLNRPFRDPHLWHPLSGQISPSVFAGKDLECGGTWMGVNCRGIVSGVTNVSSGSRDPTRLSRGHLVLRCLAHESIHAIREELAACQLQDYNPFNLFCVSRDSGFLISNASPQPIIQELQPGPCVVTNRVITDPDDPKRKWIHSELLKRPQGLERLVPFLSNLFSHHGQDEQTHPICIHLPGYGTVSSHFVFLGTDLVKSRFLHCSGPPCRNTFQDRSAEFRALFKGEIAPAH